MAVSTVVNCLVAEGLLYPVARRTESAALEADAAHHRTDVWTSAGVVIGLIIVKLTGLTWIDPLAAILVALLILYTAYQLIISSGRVLLDETLPEYELEMIRTLRQGASRRPHRRLPPPAGAPGGQPPVHRPAHHRR